MAASAGVTAIIDQLIDLFNRRSMDLPDGFLTRKTQFLLNGVPFEERLGRGSRDPLVLMLTRGPAGYRFIAKAVHHALPDAQLQRGDLDETVSTGMVTLRGQCWLSGHLRGIGEAADVLIDLEVTLRSGIVERANTTLDERSLRRLQDARLRP